VFGLRGLRRGHWLFVSFALLLLALGLASVGMESDLGPWAVRLVGLGLALRGALRQLLLDYRDQSASLLSARVSLASAQDRIQASRRRAEEQAHEARSALAAIDGASSTLERYRDRLPPDTRAQLMTAVKGEIRRLQRLVDPAAEPVAAFEVARVVGPLVAAERARGTLVEERIPARLHAVGRREATADIVRSLLDNARRYAPGPVVLRAETQPGRVVLRVEDRGPGVAPAERTMILTRGGRGRAARGTPGSGLGLALALELAREQDGDLWVEDREGGGASFALALPAASAVAAHDGDDRREGVEDDEFRPPGGRDGAHARVGLGRQPDDDPGGHRGD
jgi:signal transduction histidine kinase